MHAETDDSNDDISPRFRQYIKEKKFTIKDYGSYGLSNVLVTPANHKQKVAYVKDIYIYVTIRMYINDMHIYVVVIRI